jgi:hypothetical protein
MQRNLSKHRDAAKWHGRICPKIKKKMNKLNNWSMNCIVKAGRNYNFSVQSHGLERT